MFERESENAFLGYVVKSPSLCKRKINRSNPSKPSQLNQFWATRVKKKALTIV